MNGIKLRGTGRCVPANTVTNVFIGYINKSNEFSSERCKADRSKLRCFRTD